MADEDFDFFNSRTYPINTGCGKLFITVCSLNGQIVKVIAHRKSVFHCDLTFFDALNRQTSFMTNRELEQTIEDLKGNDSPKEGHYCTKYNVTVKTKIKAGEMGAYSCADAMARAIEKDIKEGLTNAS